jgi:hypothetical protein
VIANYVEALTTAAPPRVAALSSMGASRTGGLGSMITALSLLEQGLRDLISSIAFVRTGGFFENFLFGLQELTTIGRRVKFMPSAYVKPSLPARTGSLLEWSGMIGVAGALQVLGGII